MPLLDGLSRKQVQELAITTLRDANTLAGLRVYAPMDWPTKPELFPLLLVQIPQERKVAIARGPTSFLTTMTLLVVGRIAHLDQGVVEACCETLAAQVEDALISTTSFIENIQQFPLIETQMVVTSDAKYQIGEIGVRFEVEIPQLYGPTGVPLIGVRGAVADQISGETLATAGVDLQGA